MSNELDFELVETVRDGGWAVEAIDHGGEGEVARVLFTGQNSEALAREYARLKNGERLTRLRTESTLKAPMGDPQPREYGCAVCANMVGAPHEGACTKRGYLVAPSDCHVPEKQEKQK